MCQASQAHQTCGPKTAGPTGREVSAEGENQVEVLLWAPRAQGSWLHPACGPGGSIPVQVPHGQCRWPREDAWLSGRRSEGDRGRAGGGSWKQVPTGSMRPDLVPGTGGGFRKEEGVWRGGGQLEREGGGQVRSSRRNQCGAGGPLFQSVGGWVPRTQSSVAREGR